jgi:hypothetical protein
MVNKTSISPKTKANRINDRLTSYLPRPALRKDTYRPKRVLSLVKCAYLPEGGTMLGQLNFKYKVHSWVFD